jgi:hypothetical protein
MSQRETTKRGTRMWGVVTPRGKVLAVSSYRGEVAEECHYEIKHEGAKVQRVVVTAEAGKR